MQKLGFLYFGRLDSEKGFDAIIKVIERFGYGREELPFEIFIFGNGIYENTVKNLAEQYSEVHYFGFQPLSTIFRYVENCHYCLMPSTFLETFGLSAVNALGWGLPVVAYKKGGLEPFVFEGLDLAKYDGFTVVDQIESFIRTRIKAKDWEKQKKSFYDIALKVSDAYHQVDREKKMEKLLGKQPQKILMLSDFVNKIAGIETYIDDASKAMRGMGHQVILFGGWSPRGKIGKVWRYGSILFSFFNIFFAVRLFIKVKIFKPDVVWFHSSIRWIGWMGYVALSFFRLHDVRVWQMFHDFGYFYAFPNQLKQVKEVKTPLRRKTFITSSGTVGFKKIFVWGKYINILLLKYFSKKNVDLFLVPSEYMKPLVSKSWNIVKNNITVLEHFVQE